MTTTTATTREQSARLLQCGVDPETADMCWYKAKAANKEGYTWILISENYQKRRNSDEFIPAWSLSTLLSLLPKEICDENDDSFYFSLAKELPLTNEYCATYLPCWDKGDALVRKRDNDPIEACAQLIEWLTANNYKLNQL